MKKSSRLKRALIVLTVILLALATVCISAAASKERVSEIQIQSADHTHVYGNWVVNQGATCTNEGLKTRYCTYPGCTAFYTSTIAVTNDAHLYGEWTTTKEATCNAVGKETATCTECGYVATRAISKEEHTIAAMFDDNGNFNSNDWVITKAPVHGKGLVTQEGFARTNCAICGTTVIEKFHYSNNWHNIDYTDDSTLVIISKPTCTQEGYGTRKCTICGDVVAETIDIDPEAHDFGNCLPRVDKAATCQSEGEGYNYCTLCEKAVKVVIERDPDAHVDANGNPAQWYVSRYAGVHVDGIEAMDCAECGGHFTRTLYGTHGLSDDDFELRANPTCIKAGLKVAYCSACKINVEKEIPINSNHKYAEGDVIREATCAEPGLIELRCERCYGHFTYEEIPTIEHTYVTPWYGRVDPTCTTSGSEYNDCIACGEKQIVRILPRDPDAHVFDNDKWVEIPSDNECLTPKARENTCINCQKTITETYPKHHSFLVTINEVKATCTKEGLVTQQCSKCSDIITTVIPVDKDAHKFVGDPAVVKAATCQNTGYGLKVCSQCSEEIYVELPIDEDYHVDSEGNHIDWQVYKAASGCENGIKILSCPSCGVTKTATIYSTHGFGEGAFDVYVSPSCESGGMYRSKNFCPTCHNYVYIPIEAGHTGVLMKTIRAADCENEGLAFYKCSRGDHYYYEIIPVKGHTVSGEYKITKYPTCTENGEKQLFCSTCGDAIYPPETITNGHNMSSWIIDEGNKATCNKSGVRYRFCLICNGNREETPYNLSHTPALKYAEGSSCATGGTIIRYCTVCNQTLGTITTTAKPGTHPTAVEKEVKACASVYNATNLKTEDLEKGKEIVIYPGHCYGKINVCADCGEPVKKSGNYEYWVSPGEDELVECKICNTKYCKGELSTHDNAVIEKGKSQTCTEDGLTDSTYCMMCGVKSDHAVMPATGHNFQFNENGNKVCTRCGVYKVNVIKPDGTQATSCDCFCHDKGTIAKVLFKFCNFFWKLLGVNQSCDCGTVHWEK